MWWRHATAASIGGGLYGGERFAAVMWPEVSANVWLAVWLGCWAVALLIVYRKYVVALVSGKHSITWILHYRQRHLQKAIRSILREQETKRMRRMAEAVMLQFTEDPEKRQRMLDKVKERWEKEDKGENS